MRRWYKRKAIRTLTNSFRFLSRRISSPFRTLPSVLLIGAQRSGTTSLYNYLIQHPGIAPTFRKEVHYFDRNRNRPIGWYRAHFPLKSDSRHVIDATPAYLYAESAPSRAHELLPTARLIAILRPPWDRAYSHYRYNVRRNRESREFGEAIAEELGVSSESVPNRYSYLRRGFYHRDLDRWAALYSRNSILVLDAREFFADPQATVDRVFSHLSLSRFSVPDLGTFGTVTGSSPDSNTVDRLREYYREDVRRLKADYGIDFDA